MSHKEFLLASRNWGYQRMIRLHKLVASVYARSLLHWMMLPLFNIRSINQNWIRETLCVFLSVSNTIPPPWVFHMKARKLLLIILNNALTHNTELELKNALSSSRTETSERDAMLSEWMNALLKKVTYLLENHDSQEVLF